MRYEVVFNLYTERHYIKSFEKKYPGAWDKTRRSLEIEFARIDLLFQTRIAEIISTSADNQISICKTEFKILGSNVSRHASGCRCIIALHRDTASVNVLLVYGKGNVSGTNETVWWSNVVRENYPIYRQIF